MKYIIFRNNNLLNHSFFRLAPNEDIRDKWLATDSAGLVAIETNDADYRKKTHGKSEPSLVDGSVIWTDYEHSGISDATEAKKEYKDKVDYLINTFKHITASKFDSDADAKSIVDFLENIDTDSVSSWDDNYSIMEYIYDLPGCPQVFWPELVY
jgi:predicted Rdx family selenoprotein|tara:strand:- start:56 stop:517 length:462 start_codon:yes stop_codon:yes gene_type:complete